MARALRTFTASYGGIRLRVRLLATITAVDREFGGGRSWRANHVVHAYFDPKGSHRGKHDGTVVIALDGNIDELIPHEVTHAVIHRSQGVSAADDEFVATAIGRLSALIFTEARKHTRRNA